MYGRGCGGPDGSHVVLEGNTTGLCDSSVLWVQVSGFYFKEYPEMLIIYGFQITSSIWKHMTLVGVCGKQLGRGQSAKQKGVKITSHSADLHSGPQIKPRHSSAWGQRWVLWACRPQSGCLSQRAKSKSIFIKLLYKPYVCQSILPSPPMAGKISSSFPWSLSELETL